MATKEGSLPTRRKRKNPLPAAGVAYVDYKDVDLLRTFISDRGKIRSRRVTGLTQQQQRTVARAIKNAPRDGAAAVLVRALTPPTTLTRERHR
jgi:small subunit ribosomal protein S18